MSARRTLGRLIATMSLLSTRSASASTAMSWPLPSKMSGEPKGAQLRRNRNRTTLTVNEAPCGAVVDVHRRGSFR